MNAFQGSPPPVGFYESVLGWTKRAALKQRVNRVELYPEIPIPAAVGEEALLIRDKPKASNKAFVVCIPKGRVWKDRAVIAPDNKLLWDVSPEWGVYAQGHSIFQEKQLPPIVRSKEAVAVLNHPAAHNYYHWMLEVLARIHLLQQSNLPIDRFIVNHTSLPFQLQSLERCRIPEDTIIQPHEQFHLQSNNLVVPSYVNLPNEWSCRYVRQLFLSGQSQQRSTRTRLYISRTKYRKLTNEKELYGALKRLGFKKIKPESLSLDEQVRLFQSAELIVSPHGAALANLVFYQPGTKVVELFSPSYLEPHYWLISRLLRLDYRFIVGNRENPHPYWSGFDNISVDPDRLLNIIGKLAL